MYEVAYRVPRVVPWRSWAEWRQVADALDDTSDDAHSSALGRTDVWRARGGAPAAVSCTADLLRAMAAVRGARSVAAQRVADLQLGLSVIRFVNAFVDARQSAAAPRSVASMSNLLGIPRVCVDVRHEATHATFPPTPVLVLAGSKALEWLREQYWDAQRVLLDSAGVLFDNQLEGGSVDAARAARAIMGASALSLVGPVADRVFAALSGGGGGAPQLQQLQQQRRGAGALVRHDVVLGVLRVLGEMSARRLAVLLVQVVLRQDAVRSPAPTWATLRGCMATPAALRACAAALRSVFDAAAARDGSAQDLEHAMSVHGPGVYATLSTRGAGSVGASGKKGASAPLLALGAVERLAEETAAASADRANDTAPSGSDTAWAPASASDVRKMRASRSLPSAVATLASEWQQADGDDDDLARLRVPVGPDVGVRGLAAWELVRASVPGGGAVRARLGGGSAAPGAKRVRVLVR